MLFLLSEMDIKAILLEGEFNKEKYLDNIVVGSWYISSSIDKYLEEQKEEKYRKFKEYLSNKKIKKKCVGDYKKHFF